MLSQMVAFASQPWGGKARQSTRVCVFIVYVSVSSKSDLRNSREGELPAKSAVPSLCSSETRPWLRLAIHAQVENNSS
jgi:hypothetical protein